MEQRDEQGAVSANFQNLPNELLVKVFNNLKTNELCKVGRVCYRWYELTRLDSLWKTVDCQHMTLTPERIEQLIDRLRSNTEYLRIHSDPQFDQQVRNINSLKAQCPKLQTLIFKGVTLTNFEISFLPVSVTTISVRECLLNPLNFYTYIDRKIVLNHTGEIRVLDCRSCTVLNDFNPLYFNSLKVLPLQELYLSKCPISDFDVFHMLSIPGLRVLDLEETNVRGSFFGVLNTCCPLLEKLFLGNTKVSYVELQGIEEGFFVNLKEICFIGNLINWNIIRSIAASLPSLESISGIPRSYVLSERISIACFGSCDHFFK